MRDRWGARGRSRTKTLRASAPHPPHTQNVHPQHNKRSTLPWPRDTRPEPQRTPPLSSQRGAQKTKLALHRATPSPPPPSSTQNPRARRLGGTSRRPRAASRVRVGTRPSQYPPGRDQRCVVRRGRASRSASFGSKPIHFVATTPHSVSATRARPPPFRQPTLLARAWRRPGPSAARAAIAGGRASGARESFGGGRRKRERELAPLLGIFVGCVLLSSSPARRSPPTPPRVLPARRAPRLY